MQAWIDHKVDTHGSNTGAQHALWRAHQMSLHGAIDCFSDLLDQEPGPEQEFIRYVVENVDISALKNLPSEEFGALGMHNFIGGYFGSYPDYGDVTYSNAQISNAGLLDNMQQYGYLVATDLIGLNSGWFWAGWD